LAEAFGPAPKSRVSRFTANLIYFPQLYVEVPHGFAVDG
jgi:hypothetical protein